MIFKVNCNNLPVTVLLWVILYNPNLFLQLYIYSSNLSTILSQEFLGNFAPVFSVSATSDTTPLHLFDNFCDDEDYKQHQGQTVALTVLSQNIKYWLIITIILLLVAMMMIKIIIYILWYWRKLQTIIRAMSGRAFEIVLKLSFLRFLRKPFLLFLFLCPPPHTNFL